MKLSLCSEKVLFLDKIMKSSKSEYIVFELFTSVNIYLYASDLSQMSIVRLDREFFDEYSATEEEMLNKNVFAIPFRKLYEQNMKSLDFHINYDVKVSNNQQFDTQIFYHDSNCSHTGISMNNQNLNSERVSAFSSSNCENNFISGSYNSTFRDSVGFLDLRYRFSSMDLYRKIPTVEKQIYDIEFSSQYLFSLDLSGIKKLVFDLKEKEILFSLGNTTKISTKTFDLTLPGAEFEKKFALDTDFLKNMITISSLFDEYCINLSEETINFVFTLADCSFNVFSSI